MLENFRSRNRNRINVWCKWNYPFKFSIFNEQRQCALGLEMKKKIKMRIKMLMAQLWNIQNAIGFINLFFLSLNIEHSNDGICCRCFFISSSFFCSLLFFLSQIYPNLPVVHQTKYRNAKQTIIPLTNRTTINKVWCLWMKSIIRVWRDPML